jgi:hypothetical protein
MKGDNPEVPIPLRMRRGIELRARELKLTGGIKQIGHLLLQNDVIDGWIFRRCRCGFTLALTPTGKVWWLRAVMPAIEIASTAALLKSMTMFCRFHPRHPRNNVRDPRQQPRPSAPPPKPFKPPPQHLPPSFMGAPRRDGFGKATTPGAFGRSGFGGSAKPTVVVKPARRDPPRTRP